MDVVALKSKCALTPRFLPKFKKKNVQRKKPKKRKEKKSYTPFPPPPKESKEDKQIESGEYFMSQQEKRRKEVRITFSNYLSL